MQNDRRNIAIVLSCLFCAVLIEAKLPTSSKPIPAADGPFLSLPYQIGPYTGREAHPPELKGYPGEIHRIYRQGQASPVELLVFPTAINHPPEHCFPYLGWTIIDRGRRHLQANPAVELQTLVAVPDDSASEHPLACGFYWRRNNTAGANILREWLQQRWSTITEAAQGGAVVSICTTLNDVRQAEPGKQRVYEFATELEPFFRATSAGQSSGAKQR